MLDTEKKISMDGQEIPILWKYIFNLEKLISGDLNEDKILQNLDIILIRENPNFKTPGKVSILGQRPCNRPCRKQGTNSLQSKNQRAVRID